MRILALCALAALPLIVSSSEWSKDNGKPAPELIAAGWAGSPVQLQNLRGNTVVMVFWSDQVAC